MTLSSVVLPDPLAPITAVTAPGEADSETSSSALTPANAFDSEDTRSGTPRTGASADRSGRRTGRPCDAGSGQAAS